MWKYNFGDVVNCTNFYSWSMSWLNFLLTSLLFGVISFVRETGKHLESEFNVSVPTGRNVLMWVYFIFARNIVLTWYLLFFREEQVPSFITTPSSPLYPVENENITLQWTYTLDGAPLDEVEVLFTPDSSSPSELRVARYRTGGTTQVANDFQVRFVFSLTDSQSTIIIHFSQRSDSGTYELVVSPDDLNLAALKDKVKISVKCKWNFFSLIFT